MSDRTRTFVGYAYRTSARFGGPVEVAVAGDEIRVTGYRTSRPALTAWLVAQGILLWAWPVALLARVLTRNRRYGRLASFLVWANWAVVGFGSLLLWLPGERDEGGLLYPILPHRRAHESRASIAFRRADVSDLRITNWYARHSLWVAGWLFQLVSYLVPLRDRVVVFDVPDDDRPERPMVFAILLPSAEEAREMARMVGGQQYVPRTEEEPAIGEPRRQPERPRERTSLTAGYGPITGPIGVRHTPE